MSPGPDKPTDGQVASAPIPAPPLRPTTRRRPWLWLMLLAVLAAGIYFIRVSSSAAESTTEPRAGGKKATGPIAIPVVATKVHTGNIGVYFTGLGTVTPIQTVTIKSRVDGQLMKVYFNEGDTVHQGDPLIELDPRPYQVQLTQAQGQLAKDQAALANARIDLWRYQTLFEAKAIAEQQMATQQATVTQDEGVVKADQGQIDSAELNISYCHIAAPITGRIGLRLVDPGNIVHAADPNGMLVITQIQPISVLFTLAEDQLPVVLRKLASQKLTVDAYDREMKNKLAQGQLAAIDNQIDQTTGTLKLRATFDNQNAALFPNQFVNARLLIEEKQRVPLVNTAAIQRNSQATYVYVVKPDSTVTVRSISVGAAEGEMYEITSGLKAGEVVVMTGVDKLQEGSTVAAQISSEKSRGQAE